MADIAQKSCLELFVALGTLHLRTQPFLVALLEDDEHHEEDDDERQQQIPHPVGHAELAERLGHFAVHLVDEALVLHFLQLGVDALYKFLVVAHVAILTRRQRQVLAFQVSQVILFNKVV